MLTRILGACLVAGVLSGLAVSGLQQITTVPLILEAEVYEKAAEKAAAPEHSSLTDTNDAKLILVHGDMAAEPGHAEAWEPEDGLQRTAFTTVATVGTSVGFALMLLAAMLASGVEISPKTAAVWGLAAFISTGLAPGLGLAPELPGSAAAELLSRQIWWVSTAAMTAAGIWLLFRSPGASRLVAGLALIAMPHIFGAPDTHAFTSTAPAELAGHFASASLALHAVLWIAVGASVGYFWQRFNHSEALA